MKKPKIEVFEGTAPGRWYWRLRARNGKIKADGSEDYTRRRDALRAAKRAQVLMAEAEVSLTAV